VHVPERGVATALVDGRLVQAGDRVGDRVVVAVDRQGIVLRSARGDDRLPLLDGTPKLSAGTLLTSNGTRYAPAGATAPQAAGMQASAHESDRPRLDRERQADATATAGAAASAAPALLKLPIAPASSTGSRTAGGGRPPSTAAVAPTLAGKAQP
jgi:hypothetical protein